MEGVYKQRYSCVSYFLSLNSYSFGTFVNAGVVTKAYSEPYQRSTMELFGKIVNGFKLLTIFPKSSIVDVKQGLKYV